MPIKLATQRVGFTAFGFVLTMQPAAGLTFMLRKSIVRSLARTTLICAFAVGPLSAMAEPPSAPSPTETPGATAPVRVQPRGNTFAPNSSREKATQKRITDFDEMQRVQEESFDRKLTICRRC